MLWKGQRTGVFRTRGICRPTTSVVRGSFCSNRSLFCAARFFCTYACGSGGLQDHLGGAAVAISDGLWRLKPWVMLQPGKSSPCNKPPVVEAGKDEAPKCKWNYQMPWLQNGFPSLPQGQIPASEVWRSLNAFFGAKSVRCKSAKQLASTGFSTGRQAGNTCFNIFQFKFQWLFQCQWLETWVNV